MVPEPGQRWRSLIGGHTVVVTRHLPGDGVWIRFDDSTVTTRIDTDEFVDDHEFVERIWPRTLPTCPVHVHQSPHDGPVEENRGHGNATPSPPG